MEPKFTQGEWKSNPDVRTSINCDGKHICMVNWNPISISEEEHKANVRLIENAPKMFKILEMLEKSMFLGNVAEESDEAWLEWFNSIDETEKEFQKVLEEIRG